MPSELMAQWAKEDAFVAWGLDRHPWPMRKEVSERWKRVEELIAQHGIMTTVIRLLRGYRNSANGGIYGTRTANDLRARPLGMLFLAHGDEEIEAPLGLLLAVHDLAAAVDRIVQFDAAQYLSPSLHRQAQRKNASRDRKVGIPRDEKLDRIGRKLKRRGWIVGRLKANIDLIEEMKAEFKCCEKDVLDAASKAGLRGKRGRPKKEANAQQKMAS